MRLFYKIFLQHPQLVGEGYFSHAGFALRIAAMASLAAMLLLIHAVIPCLFKKSASSLFHEIGQILAERNKEAI